jgi:DNA-binding response OmpR family regulator
MPHRIAVFNHSPNILLLIESLLGRKGFEVLPFVETLTEISRVVELSPDLVIIGHVNGYDDGELEIIHSLRSEPASAHIPIIVCTTGAAHIRANARLESVSYVTIVPKPFDVQELLAAVYRALGLRMINPGEAAANGSRSDAPSVNR